MSNRIQFKDVRIGSKIRVRALCGRIDLGVVTDADPIDIIARIRNCKPNATIGNPGICYEVTIPTMSGGTMQMPYYAWWGNILEVIEF